MSNNKNNDNATNNNTNIEIDQKNNDTHTTPTNTSFPWLLDVFGLECFDLFRMINYFVGVKKDLNAEIVSVSMGNGRKRGGR